MSIDLLFFNENLKIEGMASLAEGSKMTFSKKTKKIWRPVFVGGEVWQLCDQAKNKKKAIVFKLLFIYFVGEFRWVVFLFFLPAQHQTTNNNNNLESGGQRGWDLGFPALHRHHSGTGRKDTQNGKRCGN